MVMGTSSSVGKSLLVTALCRIFAQDGWRVAPFKAQNMSLNSYATKDGKEMGRAQVVQAQAAGIEPTVDMNPILLKPEGDARSQVVVMGKPWATLQAGNDDQRHEELWPFVTDALDRLRTQYDLVIIEGAGSAVEPNLRASDIVNMRVAQYANAPVLLAGDIDRGGVFAHLLGTLDLLTSDERARIRGFIINKFRGDVNLLTPALTFIAERTGVPVLGVVPYLRDLRIAEEDSVALDTLTPNSREAPPSRSSPTTQASGTVDIAVIRLPHLSNFDDFDALALEANVRVRFVSTLDELAQPDAVILPGTKSAIADLAFLNQTGLAAAIVARARQRSVRCSAVVGICGGYQMLGTVIRDPLHVESERDEMAGLGLLPIETIFETEKATEQVSAQVVANCGFLRTLHGQTIHGYEIHMGRTQAAAPFLRITERGAQAVSEGDGAVDESGSIFGSYLHGIFDNTNFRRAWLNSLRPHQTSGDALRDVREREYNRLADAVRAALNMDAVRALL
ncbi:MAG: cobyric acid synthase [Chloroflexi bacterium]|nr:cobyric acid synthase [Chloroflexota bacterium]